MSPKNDRALPTITMDLLSNVLGRADHPGEVGGYLSEEIRELTGARCVIFIQCPNEPAVNAAHRVIAINPERRRPWAQSPVADALFRWIHGLSEPRLLHADERPELAEALEREGFELSLAMPLNAGAIRVGALILLGLPDEERIGSLLALLGTLSGIVALVLRNAFLFENQERVIAERTRQLEANNWTLRQSEANLRDAQEIARIGRWELDLRTNHLAWSDGIYTLFEVNRESFAASYESFMEFVHPGDRALVDQTYRESIETRQQHYEVEHRLLMKDGRVKWVCEIGRNEYDATGKPIRSVGTVQDITERKRAEEALRASEERFRSYFELPLIGIAMSSPEKGWLEANDRLCEILGYSREELMRMTWSQLTHPEDLPADLEQFARVQAGQFDSYSMEKRFIRKDGRTIHTEISVRGLRKAGGEIDYFVVLIQDISERKRTEAALKERESLLRAVIDNMPLEFWARDMEGRCFLENAPLVKHWGSMLGLRPEDTNLSSEELAIWTANNKRAMAGECVEGSVEYTVGGEIRTYQNIIAPIQIGDSIQGILGMNIDITERKRAEEALRNTQAILQAAMDQSQAGIAIADAPSGALRYVNDAGLLIRGGDRQTIVNGVGIDQYVASWNMLDFDGNPFKSDEVPLARAILFGETCSREFIVRRTSDDDRIVLAKAAPIRDNQGNVVAGIVIFMDITERKRDEEALRKANEALAEADRRKDEFLAMLAHELRNPLEPIRCSVHIMRQLAPTMPTLFKQQDMIDRQVTHMARLIDDLLDVSRITRGTIRLKRNKLDLREAIGNAIESGLPRITQQKLQLRYQNPPSPVWVEGDITRLEQILGNLLGNAAKFTDADGQIEVRLGVEPAGRDQPAPMATLRVRDTGVGIAPEMLPRIFDLFVQADQSLDRTRGGLGIGLTMVKRLVEMHGGRIEVRSEGLGQGSEFIVRLPLVLNDQPPLAQQPLEPKARAKNRILVVDDIPDAAQSLADLLTLWGHEVAIAFNGAQAVESARRFRPDVVLLDIGLPGENGYQVARRLREEAGLTTAKLIAVTGYGRDEDFDQSKDAGFALHLTKPVDLKILQNIL